MSERPAAEDLQPIGSEPHVIWIINGDSAELERYRPYGEPKLVTDWRDTVTSPKGIINQLIHAKTNDRLAVGARGSAYNIVMATAIWFLMFREAQVIIENGHGGLTMQFMGRYNLMAAVDLARRSWEEKATRP